MVAAPPPPSAIANVRRFNRFYTQKIGALDPHHLDSPFSLTELRVLYEVANGTKTTASDIALRLGLDAGYLSRILARFARRRLVARTPSSEDGRRTLLAMTERGRAVLAPLEVKAAEAIAELLAPLGGDERGKVVQAMRTIETSLAEPRRGAGGFTIREPRPGDLGWVIERHGALYHEEYGFDARFEGLVADIVAAFLRDQDPTRERAWIADDVGVRLGCIFLVKASPTLAKLRLFLVEPSARGRGLGHALVAECLAFARAAGYEKVTLYTESVLHAARRIYEQAGFRLVSEDEHATHAADSRGQTWELALAQK
jgi:DNA-binding MarR family transcriptional regulator/GNAT superfamily N-acetyltransferase